VYCTPVYWYCTSSPDGAGPGGAAAGRREEGGEGGGAPEDIRPSGAQPPSGTPLTGRRVRPDTGAGPRPPPALRCRDHGSAESRVGPRGRSVRAPSRRPRMRRGPRPRSSVVARRGVSRRVRPRGRVRVRSVRAPHPTASSAGGTVRRISRPGVFRRRTGGGTPRPHWRCNDDDERCVIP
jgi:hypothetical protein